MPADQFEPFLRAAHRNMASREIAPSRAPREARSPQRWLLARWNDKLSIPMKRASYTFVLPAAIIGMLVIYCLKDVRPAEAPNSLPELIAAAVVVALRCWKRNSLVSILSGTAVCMALTLILR